MNQPAAAGALPSLRAATEPDVAPGTYYGPDGRNGRRGNPVLVESNGHPTTSTTPAACGRCPRT